MMSVLLAGLCVAAIVLAVVAFVRGPQARLFGRPLHRPRMWGVGVVCLGLSGLVRLAVSEELVPKGWEGATGVVYVGLSGAFMVVLVSHLVLQIRAHG
ncbi:hypothetical protein HH310_33715 [Actinoplanes sp. TBRC 11911]|uniref:hypothetical protein n=1 Tax=Actinoplanes sp. TBRC 11911 TaxID=2729386 RepID=UPI00145EB44A|nr:hypothetical protein [Actinoplanes sp. TBRC 11911]NMO56124.1 hypothetical protein [Actinoplanes sp. TBRC 11911]